MVIYAYRKSWKEYANRRTCICVFARFCATCRHTSGLFRANHDEEVCSSELRSEWTKCKDRRKLWRVLFVWAVASIQHVYCQMWLSLIRPAIAIVKEPEPLYPDRDNQHPETVDGWPRNKGCSGVGKHFANRSWNKRRSRWTWCSIALICNIVINQPQNDNINQPKRCLQGWDGLTHLGRKHHL